jgi:hypothetical protein
MLVFSYYVFFQIAALLVALYQYPKIKDTQYKYFIPYLLFIVVYETGQLNNWFVINHMNLWIINIAMTISFLFYSFFLLNIIRTISFKKWIKRAVFLSILCSLIDMTVIQDFWHLNTIAILLQLGILIMITCLYFYELLNYTEETLSIVRLPEFWLNTGLLFYCLVSFLSFSAFAYLAYSGNQEYQLLFDIFADITNIILYSCLIVTFICFNRITHLYF